MTNEPLELPVDRDLFRVILSLSGGKDSTATALRLRESGIEFDAVFSDTGWESPETYDYLGVIERVLGISIARVGVEGGMRAKIRARAGFPARMQRWCTRELKVEPLRKYHEKVSVATNMDTLSVVGIRAEESEARAAMPLFEFDSRWGGYVWRPIRDLSISDVLALHHRHGMPVNPLYKRGHSRVGCWPCIYASKEQIRIWAEDDPAGVEELAALEAECTSLRVDRNAIEPGRYSHAAATFFQSRQVTKTPDGKRVYLPMYVGQVVEWAKTDRGGRQTILVREAPDSGCFRWGMCEPPSAE